MLKYKYFLSKYIWLDNNNILDIIFKQIYKKILKFYMPIALNNSIILYL